PDGDDDCRSAADPRASFRSRQAAAQLWRAVRARGHRSWQSRARWTLGDFACTIRYGARGPVGHATRIRLFAKRPAFRHAAADGARSAAGCLSRTAASDRARRRYGLVAPNPGPGVGPLI